MKCPECGQWNRASMPHCINCGAPLNIDEASRLQWKDTLKDGAPSTAYLRADEFGQVDNTPDARDELAGEMQDLKKRKREADLRDVYETQAKLAWEVDRQSYSVDLRDWRRDAYEEALRQFLADPKISTRDKEIFRRVALCGESPEAVAAVFDLKRNNVDQIKSRMVQKLKALAIQYASVCQGTEAAS